MTTLLEATGFGVVEVRDVVLQVPDVAGLWERLRAGNQPGVGPVEDTAGGCAGSS